VSGSSEPRSRDGGAKTVLREEVRPSDVAAIRDIVVSTGFFGDHEVDVAVELVEERLARGPASGYHFLFAEADGRPVGYTCFGPIACTLGSYDLYWIVVHAGERGHGIGRKLLAETECRVARLGGRKLYIETSSRELYVPTRKFYARCGYAVEARLEDFYAPGDAKVIFSRSIEIDTSP